VKSLVQGWWVAAALAASACGAPGSADSDASQGPSESRRLAYDELDLTAPETVASVSPDAEASGEHHGPVTVTLRATDDVSGVASITYVFNGATVGGGTVAGNAVVLPPITTSGITTVSFFAVDIAGNIESLHDLNIHIAVEEEPGPEPTPEPGPGPEPTPDPGPVPCVQFDLNDYNVFLLGDYTGGTDVRGKVAAGGNIDMQFFSVGAGLDASDINNVLVAGGNLSLRYGGIFGNTTYAGTVSADRSVTMYRGALSQGTPINFTTAGAALTQLSANLNAQPVNGTVRTETWGGVFLEGTNPVLNVFSVNASVFATTKYLSISAPGSSMVVVNVVGTSAVFSGFSTNLGGIGATGVLFNFVNATSITLSNHGFYGTILAPSAHISFSNGSFDGGIYAGSMSGFAEGHINPLRAIDLCSSEPAPEPGPGPAPEPGPGPEPVPEPGPEPVPEPGPN
jgi:choice-of-anchor A domain-containing protein